MRGLLFCDACKQPGSVVCPLTPPCGRGAGLEATILRRYGLVGSKRDQWAQEAERLESEGKRLGSKHEVAWLARELESYRTAWLALEIEESPAREEGDTFEKLQVWLVDQAADAEAKRIEAREAGDTGAANVHFGRYQALSAALMMIWGPGKTTT